MKEYDYLKAKQIIEENKDNLKSVLLGMHEDWYWTADIIWENDKYVSEFPTEDSEFENYEIGGIKGSSWATPTIKLIFKDDEVIMKNCYKGDSSGEKPSWLTLGDISQSVQDNITPIS